MSGWYLLPWSQTNVSRTASGRPLPVEVGAVWHWSGQATRVDQPNLLEKIDFSEDVYAQTVEIVQSMVVSAVGDMSDELARPRGFVVSDGSTEYRITELDAGPGRSSLLLFVDHVPPVNKDLQIMRLLNGAGRVQSRPITDRTYVVIGADTWVRGPHGLKRASDLKSGDEIDAGGEKHVGVRAIRPVPNPEDIPMLVRKDALGPATPRNDMVIAPQTAVLLQGQPAEMLFGESQAFVPVEDLENSRSITPLPSDQKVELLELELSMPCVIYANGTQIRADRKI